MNKKIDTLVYVAKLSPLISKFVQSIEEGKLKKEEVWLLLNVLWMEEDADEFKKFGMRLLDVMPELLDMKDTGRMKDIMDFFTEKIREEQKDSPEMVKEIKEVLNQVSSKENIDSIIEFIPDAQSKGLGEIAEILVKAGRTSDNNAAGLVIDAFIGEKNPAYRNKYRTVLSAMKQEVTDEVMERLEYSEPYLVRDLFRILKEYAPEKAHLVANKLIAHNNSQIRWEGLDGFEPGNKEEVDNIFTMFIKEKVEELQKKAAAALLNTSDEESINRLFSMAKRNFFSTKRLLMVVELCGQMRAQQSFEYLKQIFLARSIFNTRAKDDLRAAVATSLGRIHTEEAMEILREGCKDKRAKVKAMCEIILKLDERNSEQNSNVGE